MSQHTSGGADGRPSGWIGVRPPAGAAEAAADVPALLRAGLAGDAAETDRRSLAGPAAVGAADALAAAGVGPALLARLAEAVQAAGVDELATLPAPVPDPGQARLLRDYLVAAASVPASVDRDRAFATWLGAVCVHLAIRRVAGG